MRRRCEGHNSRYRGEWPPRCWHRWRGRARRAGNCRRGQVRSGDKLYFTYCYAHRPAARIKPGDTVVTRIRDASNDVFSASDRGRREAHLTKVNPQTGRSMSRVRNQATRSWSTSTASISIATSAGALLSRLPAARARIQDRHGDADGAGPLLGDFWTRTARLARSTCPIARSQGRGPVAAVLRTIRTAPAGKECISSLIPGRTAPT